MSAGRGAGMDRAVGPTGWAGPLAWAIGRLGE